MNLSAPCALMCVPLPDLVVLGFLCLMIPCSAHSAELMRVDTHPQPAAAEEQGVFLRDGGQPAPGHESETVTITKCLADLASDVVSDRRRAVMILGKYRTPHAMDGVIDSLRDADAEVRRSALVSISEWRAMPLQARPQVLALLADADVHVRRLASSMLPDVLVGPMPLLSPSNTDGEITLQGRSTGGGLPAAVLNALLNQALSDPDTTVKRNVLSMAPYVPGALDREKVEACFAHADAQVRVLAVRAAARLRGQETARAEALSRLVRDPDVLVRREVAQALGRLGATGFKALEELSTDADPSVRLDAIRELVEKQHPRGMELLRSTVLDESLPADERRGLVLYAGLYAGDAEALLLELLGSPSAILRAEAIRALGRVPAAGRGPDFYARYLADESADVRKGAGQVLSRLGGPGRHGSPAAEAFFSSSGLGALLESPHSDVRLLAVRLGSVLAPPQRDDLLVDACLDSDVTVRCEAIRRLAMAGTDAGLEIAARSLDDPDEKITMAAIQGLSMRPSAEAVAALRDFSERCRNPAIRPLVAAALLRLNRSVNAATQSDAVPVAPAPARRTPAAETTSPRWPLTTPSRSGSR